MNTQELKEMLVDRNVRFDEGLSEAQLEKIEQLYGIRFPRALADFYRAGLPVASTSEGPRFPLWGDFSEEYIPRIQQWMANPLQWLRRDVEHGYWCPAWGDRPAFAAEALATFDALAERAPTMIPIYGHRFIPLIDGVDDPPVLSTVGRDTILYGRNLEDYLRREFLGETAETAEVPEIPFWGDVIVS